MNDVYAPLREKDFLHFLLGNSLANMGGLMISTAIGWELYERTHSALVLGWVGLTLFVPVALLALPAGQVADRFSRKSILIASELCFTASSAGLAWLSFSHGPIALYYLMLLFAGIGQAFYSPARSALLPALVSPEHLERAITWSSNAWQLASLVGPAIAGLLIALFHAAFPIYIFDAFATFVFAMTMLSVKPRPRINNSRASGWRDLVAGLRFIRDTNIMLAAITLDMFAVLLGGATTLLPVFSKDLLQVGPQGLGWLLSAQAVGAFLMGLVLAHRPPSKHNGAGLLKAVAIFGLAMVGFGLSRNFWVSWGLLCVTGAVDMVSVVVRQNLIQRMTPDAMRGRVAAVNSVFIGTSNELGGFESGLTASFWGPMRSVLFGGLGTLLVVGLVAWRSPALRNLGVIVTAPDDEALKETLGL